MLTVSYQDRRGELDSLIKVSFLTVKPFAHRVPRGESGPSCAENCLEMRASSIPPTISQMKPDLNAADLAFPSCSFILSKLDEKRKETTKKCRVHNDLPSRWAINILHSGEKTTPTKNQWVLHWSWSVSCTTNNCFAWGKYKYMSNIVIMLPAVVKMWFESPSLLLVLSRVSIHRQPHTHLSATFISR